MNPCNGCPFRDGETEEATVAQNLGCLPIKSDMIELFDKEGVALSCHSAQHRACSGLSHVRKTHSKPVLGYDKWYRGESIEK